VALLLPVDVVSFECSIGCMCFDLDSQPPIPPIAGAAVDGKQVELHSTDGARFIAFEALAEGPTGSGVIIFPDVRGLHHFYEELALRFAERGIHAIAIDYFGRTAQTDDRGDKFEFMPHVQKMDYRQTFLDATAARDELLAQGVRHVFTLGFCIGGRLAFLSAAEADLGLSGAIGFYGGTTGEGRGGMPAPLDVAATTRAPVLGLFGGTDQGIPQESIDAYGEALTAAGVENELVTYANAPHSFFDRKAADFAGESEDAWAKVMEFIDRVS
jgi:carboxymethylenebutenolidase